MNALDCASKLQMLDIYFSKFTFQQMKKVGPINLVTDIEINCAQNDNDKSLYRVIINTVTKDEDKRFSLELETIGLFKLDKSDLNDDTINVITQKNTVSIMFPFIRSQIALLTTQPGLSPVLLQPIDVNNLVDKINKA